jgi:hypothetical protein
MRRYASDPRVGDLRHIAACQRVGGVWFSRWVTRGGADPVAPTLIEGNDEDDLVEKTQAHLAAEHPGREYDREMILFMAT